jgi:hypothetical protein
MLAPTVMALLVLIVRLTQILSEIGVFGMSRIEGLLLVLEEGFGSI